jgi:hypothetical protein
MTAPTPQVDVRFHLPPGPPLPPKSWQQRYRWPIRIGSVTVALAVTVLGVLALVVGVDSRSTITANGAVTIDCGTRAAVGSAQVSFGDAVALYDADDVHGGPLATTRLDKLRVMGGDTCFAEFEVEDLKTVDVYVVRMGKNFRSLVTADGLRAGYLFV